MIIFGSVQFLSKKISKLNCFLKKNKTKPKPVQTDWFWFGFLGQKPVQTSLSHFFGLARLFSIWLGFFRFFGSNLIRFFQNFNRFLSRFDFFNYFFLVFLIFQFFYSPLAESEMKTLLGMLLSWCWVCTPALLCYYA